MSTAESIAVAGEKKPNAVFATLQRLGRCLMLPIAVLPAAGILLRLGQTDLLGAIPGFSAGAAVISAAGNAVFAWLPLIFAVGIAIGWARQAVASNTVVGGGIYGFANRMLIPAGLHHILNSVVWFLIGDYTDASGTLVRGDLNRFFAGDPGAGVFMAGFFPIMMFGLPAAALAIWRHAKPSQKKIVGGIMLSTALTAFLTGITEPLEYSFMFVAFPL